MNKTKRIVLSAIALALCLMLALSALAEGSLSTLFNAGCRLLFDTENATLNAHATFSYDGVLFKTFDGEYTQDGTMSYMNVMLQTPKEDGSVYEGGYTVIGEDGISYSIETARPQMYTTLPTAVSTSILSSTVLRKSLISFGSALLNVLDGSMSRYVAVSNVESGTQYQIQLSSGDSPAILDAALTLFSQLAAERFFGLNYDYISDEVQSGESLSWLYEDWEALFAAKYREQYGEDLPEDFYDVMWDSSDPNAETYYERYNVVCGLVDDVCTQLCNQYDTGVAVIHADGTYDYWATEDEYMVDNDMQNVLYENYTASFMSYYQQKTGETLTEADMIAIYTSNNDELYMAYQEMFDEMEQSYLALVKEDSKASAIVVKEDGTTRLIYDINAYYKSQDSDSVYYATVKDRIINTMRSLKLDKTNVSITLDAEGRIQSGEGTIRILITDQYGTEHTLDISFNATAGAYGSSVVEPFDPEAYGVVSASEYYESLENYTTVTQETPAPETDDETFVLPETVTFNGVKYQVMLEDAVNG